MAPSLSLGAPLTNDPPRLFRPVRDPSARARILALDRDLTSALTPFAAEAAARTVSAPLMTLGEGALRLGPAPVGAATLGLLVVEGMLCREVTVGSERSAELIGSGDVMRPWEDRDLEDPLRGRVAWCVLEPARVAVLDATFVEGAARWPEILAAVVERGIRRMRSTAALVATTHVKRVDIRVLALFWHMADRWGKVTPRGILVPVQLTHSRLAAIVGAQRPSVTTALSRLAERGVMERDEVTGAYLIAPDKAERELEQLCFSERSRRLRMVHRAA